MISEGTGIGNYDGTLLEFQMAVIHRVDFI